MITKLFGCCSTIARMRYFLSVATFGVIALGVLAPRCCFGFVGIYSAENSDSCQEDTAVSVVIDGFSPSEIWARAQSCPVSSHRARCLASLRPSGGASGITYSIVGEHHGAVIDANTGVITPGITESGTITVRASVITLACYDDKAFTIRPRPTVISSSTAARYSYPVGGFWTHTFCGTGGSLVGSRVTEVVHTISWPFADDPLESGTTWTLDASGKMPADNPDKQFTPGDDFDVRSFLPNPGLPQSGVLTQEFMWACPNCYGALRHIEQGTKSITFTLYVEPASPSKYAVKITTGYGASGEPVVFNYGGPQP